MPGRYSAVKVRKKLYVTVHDSLERIERRSHWDPDPYDELAINVSQPFELNQRRHVEQIRIARDVGYVSLDGRRGGLGHALDRAVVSPPRRMPPPYPLANEQMVSNAS